MNKNIVRRNKIKKRIRKTVIGTPDFPRLTVYRSNSEIYAQIIDDLNGVTLASASSYKNKDAKKSTKSDIAKIVGKQVAEIAVQKGIKKICFDRNGYLFHGRVKNLADGVREAGLEF